MTLPGLARIRAALGRRAAQLPQHAREDAADGLEVVGVCEAVVNHDPKLTLYSASGNGNVRKGFPS